MKPLPRIGGTLSRRFTRRRRKRIEYYEINRISRFAEGMRLFQLNEDFRSFEDQSKCAWMLYCQETVEEVVEIVVPEDDRTLNEDICLSLLGDRLIRI
jgi:hypothetical protein